MKQLPRLIGLVWLSGAAVSAQAPGELLDLRRESDTEGVRLVVGSSAPVLFDYSSPSSDEIVLRLHAIDPGLLVGPSQAWMPEVAVEVARETNAAGVAGTRLAIRLAQFRRYRIRTEGNALILILLADKPTGNPLMPGPVPAATGEPETPTTAAPALEEPAPEAAQAMAFAPDAVGPDAAQPASLEPPALEVETPEPEAPTVTPPGLEEPEPETTQSMAPAPDAAAAEPVPLEPPAGESEAVEREAPMTPPGLQEPGPDTAEAMAPEPEATETAAPEPVAGESDAPEPAAPEASTPEPQVPEPSTPEPASTASPAAGQSLAETRDLSLSVGSTPSSSEPAPGIAPATRVLGLSQTREENSLTVHVETDGTPTHRVFGLQGPERLVLDLIGMQVDPPQQRLDIGASGVLRVRLAQHQVSPQLVVRVVIDLEGPLPHRLVVGARSIKIIFAVR